MPTLTTQILAPTTGGANSVDFVVDNLPMTLQLSGAAAVIAGAETVTLQRKDSTGTYRNVNDPVAGLAQLTAGMDSMRIVSSGTFRAVKSATAAATGLEVIASTLS